MKKLLGFLAHLPFNKAGMFFPIFVLLGMILLLQACNFPFPQRDVQGQEVDEAGNITIQRIIVDVFLNTHTVNIEEPVYPNDTLSIKNGGEGVLDFGGNLTLRLFNKTEAKEIIGTVIESGPNTSYAAQLFLLAGGFSGHLIESNTTATFETPTKVKIRIQGTKFFVVYNTLTGVTTVGNFSGTMGVTALGIPEVISPGFYREVPFNSPPGEEKMLPFTMEQFESRSRLMGSPVDALRNLLSPTETPKFTPTSSITPTPTPTPTETATPPPSATPVPTITDTPTPTHTPTITNMPAITTVGVPNLVGLSLESGMAAIRGAGLQVGEIREILSSNSGPVTISDQAPRAGSEVFMNSTVDLVVSKIAVSKVVPEVVGKGVLQAEEEIGSAGFQALTINQPVYYPNPGIVITQDPPGGRTEAENSPVTLHISAAPQGFALKFDGTDDYASILDAGDYYAYNWFTNYATKGLPTLAPEATPNPACSNCPVLQILSVEANLRVSLRAENLPIDEEFMVLMGKMGTEGIGGIQVGTINSGSANTMDFNVNIPPSLRGEDQIAVRLQSTSRGDFDFDNAFTVEAWVKPLAFFGRNRIKAVVQGALTEPPEPAGVWAMYMNQLDNSEWGQRMCVPCSLGLLGCESICGNVQSGSGNLQIDQWQHLAATFNGNEILIYRNGQEISREAYTRSIPEITYLLIGIGSESFNGLIDEVILWNRARTPQQISADMNGEVDIQDLGLVGYWRFDEGRGQGILDSSTKKNHGRLGSTPWEDDSDPEWVKLD